MYDLDNPLNPRGTPDYLVGSEGGGDAPDWVPEGAVAYADFASGQYYAEGAETPLGAVFTGITASDLTSDGLPVTAPSTYAPMLAGGLLAGVTGTSWTAVIKWLGLGPGDSGDGNGRPILFVSDTEETTEANAGVDIAGTAGSDVYASDYNGDYATIATWADWHESGENAIAVTRAADGAVSASFNGLPVVISGVATPSTGLAYAVLGTIKVTADQGTAATLHGAIHSIAVYEALPDADLPALSA